MELKSVGVLSCGKLLGVMYTAIGLIIGGFAAMASLLGAAAQPGPQGGQGQMMIFGAGLGAVIIFPVLYGIMGFIGGIVSAFIYNLTAGMIGGIELNFQKTSEY